MKKIFLILILFVVVSQVYSQNTDKSTTALGMPISGDNVLWRSFEKTLEVLRVKLISGTINATVDTVRLDNIITKLDSLIKLGQPYTKEWSGDSLTVSTEVDTINAPSGTTTWWSMDIISVSDTLEFSFTGNFAHPRRLMPNQSKYIEKISVVDFPKVYIRNKWVGTAIYDLDMIGY